MSFLGVEIEDVVLQHAGEGELVDALGRASTERVVNDDPADLLQGPWFCVQLPVRGGKERRDTLGML